MGIEWLPRSRREGNGWQEPLSSTLAAGPRLVGTPGDRGVCVPVAPAPLGTQPLGIATVRTLALVGAATGTGIAHVWPAVLPFGLGALGSAAAVGQRVVLRHRRPSLTLTPREVRTGDLVLPWSVVEGVVRFSARGPGAEPGRHLRRWNHLALRIGDFDNVVGLSPVRAGLANLTRRHLVLVAETGELRDPGVVADALELLVERPEARLLLSGPEGVRLLTDGPTRG